jgi:hypothetical protein
VHVNEARSPYASQSRSAFGGRREGKQRSLRASGGAAPPATKASEEGLVFAANERAGATAADGAAAEAAAAAATATATAGAVERAAAATAAGQVEGGGGGGVWRLENVVKKDGLVAVSAYFPSVFFDKLIVCGSDARTAA